MEKKQRSLTNEELKNVYNKKQNSTSQFDLVNYARRLAENVIHSSRDIDLENPDQNLITHVLDKILLGKDELKEVIDKGNKNHHYREKESTLVIHEEVKSSKTAAGEGKTKTKKSSVPL